MNFNKKTYSYSKQSISWSDIWAVIKVLRSPWLTQGPKVKEFEKAICQYTGAKYCVAVANGTAALHLAVLALGRKPGDEGITSPNTFLASANCILYAGGTVKFADIEAETGNIDPTEIEKKITQKTKVLIPVHFAGQPCDMEKVYAIAKKHNLFVIEDAAHAIGSEYKGCKVGSCQFSDMTTFSFHPAKTIAMGEGGAVTTNDKALYEKLLMLRSHGVTKDQARLTQNDGPWYYQMQVLGFNYRLTDIQAAIGISQLKRLNAFVRRRCEIVDYYKDAFANDERFSFLAEKDLSKAAFHLCPLLIDFDRVKIDKKEIFKGLSQNGLQLQVHYIPVHTQLYYKKLGFNEGDFPIAEKYYKKSISLPLYCGLKQKDLNYIVSTIRMVVR
jgi:perosamine synthetase